MIRWTIEAYPCVVERLWMSDVHLPLPCVVGTPLHKWTVAVFSKMTGFGRTSGIARWILHIV